MVLPLIEFSDNAKSGADIDAALATHGFLQLANVGIEPHDIADVFGASKAFFQSDDATKRKCLYRSASENFGYQGLREENLDPDAPADLKETFTMRDILQSPLPIERWPSPEFREVMMRFYGKALAGAHRVQHTMAQALGMPDDFFVRAHSGANVTLRLLHYPAASFQHLDPGQFGAGAHTDYGFITLLFQHGVGGLQVMDSGGEWIDVPPRDDAVVVNSGDLLERWTNGKYKSTLHRVIARTGDRDRYSIAMFLDPDSDVTVEALPACVSEHRPARYAPISAGAHLQSKLEASHKGRFAQ